MTNGLFSILFILGIFGLQNAFGWGELGHHIIGTTAAKLVPFHPEIQRRQSDEKPRENVTQLIKTFYGKAIQQGHLSNIPDTHWRNLDGGQSEKGQLLGDPTHYFDSEKVLDLSDPLNFFKVKIPLNYEEARKKFESEKSALKFFKEVGTLPWRTQQLSDLYLRSLNQYPQTECEKLSKIEPHPTQIALAYAGLLSHWVGDATQPYHATVDYDGVETGQKGVHAYFEEDLVNSLEWGLTEKVNNRAKVLLTRENPVENLNSLIQSNYPNLPNEFRITALMFALLADSYSYLDEVRKRDLKFSIATFEEITQITDCSSHPDIGTLSRELASLSVPNEKQRILRQKMLSRTQPTTRACRRSPDTLVNSEGVKEAKISEGRPIGAWFEDLIVERLALASAITADIWVRLWLESKQPRLCWTWKYVLKPSFVSPTEKHCSGYALNEVPSQFRQKNGKTVLPTFPKLNNTKDCLTL